MSHITFPLLTSGGEPYYLQLYRHILKEIQKGGLQAGEKLPSKRTLAQHLSVSVNSGCRLPDAYHRRLPSCRTQKRFLCLSAAAASYTSAAPFSPTAAPGAQSFLPL